MKFGFISLILHMRKLSLKLSNTHILTASQYYSQGSHPGQARYNYKTQL